MHSARWQMNSKNIIEKNETDTSGANRSFPCSRRSFRAHAGLPRRSFRAEAGLRILLLAAVLLMLPRTLLSQSENFKPKPIPNRYLIVVETSRAMDKREGAIGQV